MASFSNCSFNKKNCAPSGTKKSSSQSQKSKNSASDMAKDSQAASMSKQKSKTAAGQSQDETCADLDKRSQQFENEFQKKKAKEFKDAHSKSKAEQNKFERSDQAKKLRRNHIDNQRNRKNQEYCFIEEKKYIKKRFVKDDSCEAAEDMDKDYAADYETAKEERARSESCERVADEKECSYNENAKQCKSQTAQRNSYHASEKKASECKNSECQMEQEAQECEDSARQSKKCSKCSSKTCKGGKSCKGGSGNMS